LGVEALDRMGDDGAGASPATRLARAALLASPVLALAVVPIFISTTDARVLGVPPIMWWIVLWILLTPLCLLGVERLRPR
jgi:hypothetical protein